MNDNFKALKSGCLWHCVVRMIYGACDMQCVGTSCVCVVRDVCVVCCARCVRSECSVTTVCTVGLLCACAVLTVAGVVRH